MFTFGPDFDHVSSDTLDGMIGYGKCHGIVAFSGFDQQLPFPERDIIEGDPGYLKRP